VDVDVEAPAAPLAAIQAQAIPVQAQAIPVQTQAMPAAHYPREVGRWSSDLCACCTNCAVCWTGWCCPWVMVAQLAQRYSPLKPNGAKAHRCKLIAGSLFCLYAVSFILGQLYWLSFFEEMSEAQAECFKVDKYTGRKYRIPDCEPGELSDVGADLLALNAFRGVIGMVLFLAMTCTVLTVRAKIRRAHQIPPSCCDEGCDDCCCACCCLPLETCRLMRHTLAHAPTSVPTSAHQSPAIYEPCSEEGTSLHGLAVAPVAAAMPPVSYGTCGSA